MTTGVAGEISYASTIDGPKRRMLARAVENLTGRRSLIRRARGYQDQLARGADIWQVMAERYGLRLELDGVALADIPATGPLVLVSNHPYGVLDGLMMGQILSRLRGEDFRILAHHLFGRAPELQRGILPVHVAKTAQLARTNIATRRAALDLLGDGGAVGVFPGGTVSTPARPFAAPMDPAWRLFPARLIARSGATVVPVFFEGANSRLFHLASHLSYSLRMGLFLKEFRARVDTPVRAMIGTPIRPERIADYAHDPRLLMDVLRQRTYALSPDPLDWRETGYAFEPRHRHAPPRA